MPSATLPPNLHMPPEHHPHIRTLTAWPDQSSQPNPATLAGAERDVAAISQAIAHFEPVTLYCRPENISRAQKTLTSTATATTRSGSSTTKHALEIRPLAIDELWIRDTGPVYVHVDAQEPTDGHTLAGLDLNFNCWGNKYSNKCSNSSSDSDRIGISNGDSNSTSNGYSNSTNGTNNANHHSAVAVATDRHSDTDRHVTRLILADQSLPRVVAPFTAEGGALELHGGQAGEGGMLMLTESSVLNANRNPGVGKADMEARLKRALGVAKVLWLPGVKGRDVTDGHVDGLARFVGDRGETVVLSRPHANAGKGAWEVFEEARAVVMRERDAQRQGRELVVVEVGEADPNLWLFEGVDEYQLCLSYVNYLVVNGGVVMPAFGDGECDETALRTMRRLFPGREVVQVLLTTICRLGGGIHCATQQVPRL